MDPQDCVSGIESFIKRSQLLRWCIIRDYAKTSVVVGSAPESFCWPGLAWPGLPRQKKKRILLCLDSF
jgi:hypothetical protein